MAKRAEAVLRALEREGLLLVTDSTLPSVASLVAGEPVRGSWWSHPAAHAIFAVLEQLQASEPTLRVKLVSGKETLVDRRLWREFFTIAKAKERWQMAGLSAGAKKLLKEVETKGARRATKDSRRAGAELEKRLLVHGKNVHTESGSHTKMLFPWDTTARELRFSHRPKDLGESKAAFEEVVTTWHDAHGKEATLPWLRS